MARRKWHDDGPNFTSYDEAIEWGESAGLNAARMAALRMQERTPVAYGYTRVSTIDQAEFGVSLEVQKDIVLNRFETRLKPTIPGITWGGMFADPGVSAYKKRLFLRPEGARLNAHLLPGDHVIFARLDRAFRKGIDFFRSMESWSARGINIHFCNPDVDPTTAAGKLMLGVMAVFAEFESNVNSERTKAGIAKARAKGIFLKAPMCGEVKAHSRILKSHVLVPSEPKMRIGELVAACFSSGLGHLYASDVVEDYSAFMESRKSHKPIRSRYQTTNNVCFRLAAFWAGVYSVEVPYSVIKSASIEKFRSMQPSDSLLLSHPASVQFLQQFHPALLPCGVTP